MAGAPAGSVNAYFCSTCEGFTVVRHVHDGVTPMFLACRASGDVDACKGRATSCMYHVPPEAGEPVWEWYKPSKGAIRRSSPDMRQHLEQGGLKLRKVANA